MNNPYSIHPECPDWRKLGPNDREAALRALADGAQRDADSRPAMWSRGFTRRRFLQGGLGVGVAALASQLVTTRVSYAAAAEPGQGTLVVVFLRGGMDGLSVLVPADDPLLLGARPDIAVRARHLLQVDSRFGLHPALRALQPMLAAGKVAAVPDIATPALSRSHFQAQDCLERGGSTSGDQRGWLDRVLEQAGPGTTFRAMSVTNNLSRSLLGTANALVARDPADLEVQVPEAISERTRAALETLYTGIEHPFAVQTRLALDASARIATLGAIDAADDDVFPDGNFGNDLSTLSALIRSDVGVRVATIDLGGWDMHTGVGNVDGGDMTEMLTALGDGLAAFFSSLGERADSTTVVVMSEFGRRMEQNGSGGTDHGHGGLALALGGGVRGGVYGVWNGLDEQVLQHGDLPGNNDFRDMLGEVVMSTLGLSAGQMSNVFDDWTVNPLGLMVPA